MFKVVLTSMVLLSAIISSACEPTIVEKNVTLSQVEAKPAVAKSRAVGVREDTRGKPIGALPSQTLSQSVADVQDTVSLRLLKAQSILPLEDSMVSIYSGVGGVANNGLEWRGTEEFSPLYLVIRNLAPLSEANTEDVPDSFCDEGEVYTGYVAAAKSLWFWVESEVGTLSTWAIPQGLIVCETSRLDNLKISLLPIDHSLFVNDAERKAVLSALPEIHPIHEGL